jgi:hypothetical protein
MRILLSRVDCDRDLYKKQIDLVGRMIAAQSLFLIMEMCN